MLVLLLVVVLLLLVLFSLLLSEFVWCCQGVDMILFFSLPAPLPPPLPPTEDHLFFSHKILPLSLNSKKELQWILLVVTHCFFPLDLMNNLPLYGNFIFVVCVVCCVLCVVCVYVC